MSKTQANELKIWIFGNPDKTELGFPMPGDLTKYLQEDVFTIEHGRYRQTQIRNADIIVLSREGVAFGHLEIDERVPPNEADKQAYPNVKQTYLVRSSTLYGKPVRLSDHSITGLSYGKQLNEEQFESLLKAAGNTSEYCSGVQLPESTIELERVFREVKQRLGQGALREVLLKIYSGKCAISGCQVVEVLEAAHIDPWCSTGSCHPSNGLLLRADLHTLFDRDLIGIEPESHVVHIAPSIRETEYGEFHGITMQTPNDQASMPHPEVLKQR